jgi:hypothetical protein
MAVRQAAWDAAEKSVATSSLSKDGIVSFAGVGIGGISFLTSGGVSSWPLETMQPQTGMGGLRDGAVEEFERTMADGINAMIDHPPPPQKQILRGLRAESCDMGHGSRMGRRTQKLKKMSSITTPQPA